MPPFDPDWSPPTGTHAKLGPLDRISIATPPAKKAARTATMLSPNWLPRATGSTFPHLPPECVAPADENGIPWQAAPLANLPGWRLARILGEYRFNLFGRLAASALSPDGRLLAVMSHWNAGVLHVLNAVTGHEIRATPIIDRAIGPYEIAFDADGAIDARPAPRRPATPASDFLDVPVVPGRLRLPKSIAVNAHFVLAVDGEAQLIEWPTGIVRHRWVRDAGEQPYSLGAITPDGTNILLAACDRIWLHATADGRCLAECKLPPRRRSVTAFAISPDSRFAAIAAIDSPILCWNLDAPHEQPAPFADHAFHTSAVVFSPDGSRLASGANDGTVRVWDVATATLANETQVFPPIADAIEFTPDCQLRAANMVLGMALLPLLPMARTPAPTAGDRAPAFATFDTFFREPATQHRELGSRCLALPFPAATDEAKLFAASADGNRVAIATMRGMIFIFDRAE